MAKKKTILTFTKMKEKDEQVAWITCYDYPTAVAAERAEIDMILVGDSGGMCLLGYKDTHPVTMEEMIMMCKAVRRGAPNTFIIGDMPQGSYEVSVEEAVRNALRFVKEAGCDAIKLEGSHLRAVRAITRAGVNVVGHLGLTPQSSETFGGYRVQGKTAESLLQICLDAYDLEEAGICFLLLEAMPELPAQKVCALLKVPTYGIGVGGKVDGQLLIVADLLGNYPDFKPKFAHNFVADVLIRQEDLGAASIEVGSFLDLAKESIRLYSDEVKQGHFPYQENIYELGKEEEAFIDEFEAVYQENKVRYKHGR